MAEASARRYGEATKALVRSIEEARLENRKNFEILSDLIRGMTMKETIPSVVLGDGVRSSERNQPRRPKEDDRGHLEDDSQTICDKDFALEIDKTEEPSQEIVEAGDPTIFWGINIDSERPTLFKKFGTEWDGGVSSQKLVVEPKEHSEVITYPLKIVVEVESDGIDGTQRVFTANRKKLFDVRMNLSESLGISSAYKVFVELPKPSKVPITPIGIPAPIDKPSLMKKNTIFDPGINILGIRRGMSSCGRRNDAHKACCKMVVNQCLNLGSFKLGIAGLGIELKHREVLWPYDRGKESTVRSTILVESWIRGAVVIKFNLDLGIDRDCRFKKRMNSWVDSPPAIAAISSKRKLLNENSIFDPGIASLSSNLSIPKSLANTCGSCSWKVLAKPHMGRIKTMSLVFDPGGVLVSCHYKPMSSYWIAVCKGTT